MSDILDKTEGKYGSFGLFFVVAVMVLFSIIVSFAWIILSIAYIWPILAPFLIASYMIYKSTSD